MKIKLILLGLFIMSGSVIGALWVSNFWLIGYPAIDLACYMWACLGGFAGLMACIYGTGFMIV